MAETTNSEVHTGPHIPQIQGESVYGPISNTTITTFLFLIIVLIFSVFGNRALKSEKKSRFKMFLITTMRLLDNYLKDSFADNKFARLYFPLIVGIFFIILFGNLFGLVIDWFTGALPMLKLEEYLRPMHSDVNTTLVLAVIAMFFSIYIAVKTSGGIKVSKGYLFNFTGHSFGEKCINVFVGWLHFIGIPSTIAALSLRLFGNIFAGIILIGVITYLGAQVTSNLHLLDLGRLFSLPFWFFEIFVAFIQAAVFAGLMIAYFNQSKEDTHH
ncbi:MAG: F0F1 ATP synthase subunit A [Candidatus Gracilibacteria bacterium]|nr:F0F1 ATP synthase subunit A [Candidatus Gracilibacteria bacterium]